MEAGPFIENLRAIIDQIREKIQRIQSSKRDKRTIKASVAVLSIIILLLIFRFFISGAERLQKQANILETDYKKVSSLRKQFLEFKQIKTELTSTIKSGDEALISLLEGILVDEQIDRGSFSIKDSNSRVTKDEDLFDEQNVDAEIRKIPLYKLVDLLYKINTNNSFLKVSKLRIRTRFDNPDLIDVNFRISRFKLKKVI
jgi:hypothetical protein